VVRTELQLKQDAFNPIRHASAQKEKERLRMTEPFFQARDPVRDILLLSERTATAE
jgi:hypothetical protein